MSTYDGPGQASPYVPPPPPPPARRGRSPWLWVAVGCGLLLLLGFGGCGALFYIVGQRAAETAKRPVTKEQVLGSLGKVPIYPGAQLDLKASQRLRVVSEAANVFGNVFSGGKLQAGMAAFQAPAPPEKVSQWYDEQFEGWQKADTRPQPGLGTDAVKITHARQYQRGNSTVQVQVGRRDDQRSGSYLILFVISGDAQK